MPKDLKDLIISDPEEFTKLINTRADWDTAEFAIQLDEIDPLKDLRELFDVRDIIPFAGHSLGPVFKPTSQEILRILNLQSSRLHEGHFPGTWQEGGNWFDCDIDQAAIAAIKPLLGFSNEVEFLYTQEGLSANLGKLLETFYLPEGDRKGICYLGKEFFSDQAIIHSVIKRKSVDINESDNYRIFPDDRGIYSEEKIIAFVKEYAKKIKVLHLSDIIFSTGQRLDLNHILNALRDVITQNEIIVGLDLAHTVGNRTINLSELNVTYAVGCAYKYICGSAGSGFGIYVNANTDLKKYPPLQGWKAVPSEIVFRVIDDYRPEIMLNKGAWAFRCSNPSPVALAPVQQYIEKMSTVGWDKITARSECLTRYLQQQLENQLGDEIEFITPKDAQRRGAMLVFRIKELSGVNKVETLLKTPNEFGRYEIDTRPPNNFRVTAHYGYTRFIDIFNMVRRLKQVVENVLKEENQQTKHTSLASSSRHLIFANTAVTLVNESIIATGADSHAPTPASPSMPATMR